MFLSKNFGDAFEIELATKTIRHVTGLRFHEGYTRVHYYLAIGNMILSGSRKYSAEDLWPSRFAGGLSPF